MTRLLTAAAALLLLAASAVAEEGLRVPPPGVGLVGAAGGVRWIPQSPLIVKSAEAGHVLSARALVQPAAIVPFSYRVDEDWSAGVEFGWSRDAFAFEDGHALELQTFTLQIKGERSFVLSLPWLEPYLGFGAGYYLSGTSSRDADGEKTNAEAHTSGVFAALGARLAVTDDVGVVLEQRVAFANVGLAGFGPASVGGATLTLGVYSAWRE